MLALLLVLAIPWDFVDLMALKQTERNWFLPLVVLYIQPPDREEVQITREWMQYRQRNQTRTNTKPAVASSGNDKTPTYLYSRIVASS